MHIKYFIDDSLEKKTSIIIPFSKIKRVQVPDLNKKGSHGIKFIIFIDDHE